MSEAANTSGSDNAIKLSDHDEQEMHAWFKNVLGDGVYEVVVSKQNVMIEYSSDWTFSFGSIDFTRAQTEIYSSASALVGMFSY